MAKLKAAVRTIGDHKQRITVNVSLEGIKIIDEKTEVCFCCLFSFQLMQELFVDNENLHTISHFSRSAW